MVKRSPKSASSSPLSFYTANDSEAEGSTTASSPVQGEPCRYRDARQLPRDLKDHCQIFLEEQLCAYTPVPVVRSAQLVSASVTYALLFLQRAKAN
jgi:hypothetical protein